MNHFLQFQKFTSLSLFERGTERDNTEDFPQWFTFQRSTTARLTPDWSQKLETPAGPHRWMQGTEALKLSSADFRGVLHWKWRWDSNPGILMCETGTPAAAELLCHSTHLYIFLIFNFLSHSPGFFFLPCFVYFSLSFSFFIALPVPEDGFFRF